MIVLEEEEDVDKWMEQEHQQQEVQEEEVKVEHLEEQIITLELLPMVQVMGIMEVMDIPRLNHLVGVVVVEEPEQQVVHQQQDEVMEEMVYLIIWLEVR